MKCAPYNKRAFIKYSFNFRTQIIPHEFKFIMKFYIYDIAYTPWAIFTHKLWQLQNYTYLIIYHINESYFWA
jgi:hypothetical protein